MIVGIGTDIVQVERIQRALERTPGFAAKVYTARELEYCATRSGAQSHAVRFAAKEALMKAVGTGWAGQVNWLDIEVVLDARGKPEIQAHNAVRALLDELGVTRIHLSLSHERDYATAVVVLENQNA